nr:4Fe-4S dicluster domain-containing protein [uncultured Treponema sp.]
MILQILFIFLFVILASFILYFIYGIFMPAIKLQTIENQDPLFSQVELNYIGNTDEKSVEVSDKIAFVLCNPERSFKKERLAYNGIQSCALFNSIYDTPNDCTFGCIGFGDCVKACPQEAILIKNGTAVITQNCCGCGECIAACPKNIIKLVEKKEIGSEIKLCAAKEDCLTTCDKCNSMSKIEIPEQKYFKFWKSCYKILTQH